jgi:hypothetical protein
MVLAVILLPLKLGGKNVFKLKVVKDQRFRKGCRKGFRKE